MLDYIRHLRTKPEETKKQIVLVALVITMSIVVIIWLATLGGNNAKTKEPKAKEDNGPSPFSILTSSFSETFKDIKSSVSEINLSGLKEDLEKEENKIKSEQGITNEYNEEGASKEIENDNFNLEE
jgi:hypothetical protein